MPTSVGGTHMYRKASEAAKPDLARKSDYDNQVPINRAVPLWGGINERGFGVISFHATKKIQEDEWLGAVDSGMLTAVIKQGRARSTPYKVLCDNEGFLKTPVSKAALRKQKVHLLHVPARSPDLRVIEKYWSWLRRELRKRDLNDLVQKRAPLGKMAYRQRILAITRSAKSKRVAANIFKSCKKVCQEVFDKKGARARS